MSPHEGCSKQEEIIAKRDCETIEALTDDRCTTINEETLRPQGAAEIGDPDLQGMLQIGLRNYIAPGTRRGPDASKLLTPRILTFTQP